MDELFTMISITCIDKIHRVNFKTNFKKISPYYHSLCVIDPQVKQPHSPTCRWSFADMQESEGRCQCNVNKRA